eukprot:CAMPEP_0182450450 /NCGR_PEP_ID=MMETSP1172-20130603/41321_1 /TAXON_ID=708627 /ORGANISM="Timspurckia oligopyrenoides, Strain CCMP3278" /LENGTH=370 /DNA_ID=CAMNT_0024648065 /DNA_START=140 /DNA_END=1252 /DNA_ORIENTATION=+
MASETDYLVKENGTRASQELQPEREAAQSTLLVEDSQIPPDVLEHDRYLTQYLLRPSDFDPDKAPTHYFRGYFRSASAHRVVVQIYIPPNPPRKLSATKECTASTPNNSSSIALLLHGYNDHVGVLQDTLKHLLCKGFCVVAVDLPGHGLSSGKQNAIHDFREYAEAVEGAFEPVDKVLSTTAPWNSVVGEAWNCVAHSTGCSAVLEYLHIMRTNDPPQPHHRIAKAVLFSPLVRFIKWRLSKAGQIFHPIIPGDYVKARPPEKRVDTRFVIWEQFDALQSDHVELEWVRAVYSWEKRTRTYAAIDFEALVVQGELDNTVLWEYNIPFLQKQLLPKAEYRMVPGATHQYLNTSEELQTLLFSWIDAHFSV